MLFWHLQHLCFRWLGKFSDGSETNKRRHGRTTRQRLFRDRPMWLELAAPGQVQEKGAGWTGWGYTVPVTAAGHARGRTYTRTANPRSFWRDVSWSVLNESHVRCKTNRDAQLKSVILQPGVEQLVYIESPCVFRSHITSTLCESLQVMQVDESFVSVCVFFLSSSLFCLFLSIFTFSFFFLSAFLSWTFTHRAFMMHLILFTWKICTRLFLCLFFKFFFFFYRTSAPLTHSVLRAVCADVCWLEMCLWERIWKEFLVTRRSWWL